jgi:hypothetical protein
MASPSDYAPITTALDAAGFHYSMRDYGARGWQLVCAAERADTGDPAGPSFWLCRSSAGRWFVVEWGGDPAYLIPTDADPAAVCVACLRGMGECMRLPAPAVAEYGLERLPPGRVVGFDLAGQPG